MYVSQKIYDVDGLGGPDYIWVTNDDDTPRSTTSTPPVLAAANTVLIELSTLATTKDLVVDGLVLQRALQAITQISDADADAATVTAIIPEGGAATILTGDDVILLRSVASTTSQVDVLVCTALEAKTTYGGYAALAATRVRVTVGDLRNSIRNALND
tara:strand:+ start:20358 stop:20831 length:474 start_codon:yes stop_codon:yes gene_type:complete